MQAITHRGHPPSLRRLCSGTMYVLIARFIHVNQLLFSQEIRDSRCDMPLVLVDLWRMIVLVWPTSALPSCSYILRLLPFDEARVSENKHSDCYHGVGHHFSSLIGHCLPLILPKIWLHSITRRGCFSHLISAISSYYMVDFRPWGKFPVSCLLSMDRYYLIIDLISTL